MKHTPGPWKAYDAYEIDEEHVGLARIGTGDAPVIEANGMFRTDLIARTADVYLIAAAPDLLEACKAAGQFVARYDYLDPDGDNLVAQLADAIAKAEGEES
jgi:hypothetical protein